MQIEIIVPRLGWSMEEGGFVAWLKKDGEFVRAGEALFSIEGDKAVQEIESIDSGVLRILPNGPKPGDPIRVGDLLGHLIPRGESEPVRGVAETQVPPATSKPVEAASPSVSAPTASNAGVAEKTPSTTRRIAISPRALRVATELGVDWAQVVGGGKTGRIRERDIRAAAVKSPGSAAAVTPLSRSVPASESEPVFLVTGGCGFIGTWVLRELLQRGLRAVVLDAGERPARWERVIGAASTGIPLVRGSLLNRELLAHIVAGQRITHIIHLAALLTPACQFDPWEGCEVNVLGSVALFEAARAAGAQIRGVSYASSVAVFGEESDHAIGASAGENRPPTFYGAFKKSAELIAEQYWRHFQIPSLGIRPQVAYGPERESGLTAGPSLAARAAARGESCQIGYTGRIGYDYVEDIARAFVRAALEMPRGAEVVDLPGDFAGVEEILSEIVKIVPESRSKISASGPVVPGARPPNARFISAIYSDWKTTSLSEGIGKTIDFYRTRRR